MDETTRAALEEMQRALTSLPDTLEEVKAVPANDEVKLFEIIEHEASALVSFGCFTSRVFFMNTDIV